MSTQTQPNTDISEAYVSQDMRRAPAFFRNKWTRVGGVVIFVVLIITASFWLSARNDHRQSGGNAFTVNGVNYSKSEIRQAIAYATNLQPKSDPNIFAKQLFTIAKEKAAADKASLTVSSKELQAAQKEIFPKQINTPKQGTWVWMQSYDQALQNKLSQNIGQQGNAKGTLFVFGFTAHMKLAHAEKPPAYSADDQKSIAADKQYAEQQADIYRKALETKTKTPEQLLAQLRDDSRLQVVNGITSEAFNGFDLASNNMPALRVPTIFSAVTTTNTAQNSKVALNTTEQSYDGWPTERYYFFVHIDQAESKYKDYTQLYDTALNSIKAEYKGI